MKNKWNDSEDVWIGPTRRFRKNKSLVYFSFLDTKKGLRSNSQHLLVCAKVKTWHFTAFVNRRVDIWVVTQWKQRLTTLRMIWMPYNRHGAPSLTASLETGFNWAKRKKKKKHKEEQEHILERCFLTFRYLMCPLLTAMCTPDHQILHLGTAAKGKRNYSQWKLQKRLLFWSTHTMQLHSKRDWL